jgi:sigma-B regulation protein RsbU (phosphoserine phosphatase)
MEPRVTTTVGLHADSKVGTGRIRKIAFVCAALLLIAIGTVAVWQFALHKAPPPADKVVLPNGCLAVVIGDVCDKGVGSALFMAPICSLLRVFTGKISLSGVSISTGDRPPTAEVDVEVETALGAVPSTNEYIAKEHGDQGMFATLCLGIINPQTGLLAYVNAGHLPLVIIGKSGARAFLNATGSSILKKSKFQFSPRPG